MFCVQCETAVALSLAGCHVLCSQSTARAAGKIARSSNNLVVTQFGSPTAQIPLESGSSADERFRIDLKKELCYILLRN